MKRHIITYHDPVAKRANQAICNMCDKAFSSKEWLVVHLRSHTGDTPFTCNYCEEKFTNKTSLNRHTSKHRNGK